MIVCYPKEFGPWLDLLAAKGFAHNAATALKRLLECGIAQAVYFWGRSNLPLRPGDAMQNYFEKCELESISLSGVRGELKITPLAEAMKVSHGVAVSCLIFIGLCCDGYHFLRFNVPDYAVDAEFRENVDSLWLKEPKFERDVAVVLDDSDEIALHTVQ